MTTAHHFLQALDDPQGACRKCSQFAVKVCVGDYALAPASKSCNPSQYVMNTLPYTKREETTTNSLQSKCDGLAF